MRVGSLWDEESEVAKSFERSVDKVERKARLANVHRQREIDERELRTMNRMGWQELEDDECEDESK
jgi:hypothetical protein